MDTLVTELGKAHFVIDEIVDRAADGGKRRNAHFEQETETKERKITKCSGLAKNQTCKTEISKLTTKEYVAEVTVVISGNCKAQIERVLDVGSPSYYFDETWDESGNEVPVDTNSPYSFTPDPTTLESYFSALGPKPQVFTFCRGKDTKPSPAGRN